MIQLPIEIGDTLLGGKFKNKRIVVKEIGLDEYGSPTVNGHSILRVRIPKLYKNLDENTVKSKYKEAIEKFQKLPITVKVKKQDKRFCLFLQTVDGEECLDPVGYETKELAQHAALTKGYTVDGYEPETNVTKKPVLEKLIREIILELDVDVKDAKIEAAINELSTLEERLADANAKLAALKKELGIDAMEKQYAKIINEDLGGLLDEMKKDEVRIVRTKTVLMEIKRFQAERATYSHEKVLDFAMTQVNQAVKFKIYEELKATEKITKIKPSLSFSKRENVLREAGLIDRAVKWISTTVKNLVTQLRPKGQNIDANLDKLERVLKIK